jgi:hypothetical protein
LGLLFFSLAVKDVSLKIAIRSKNQKGINKERSLNERKN